MKQNTLIDFKFLEDIMWYDGPLLSLGITQDDKYVFVVWCDVNYEKKFNTYAYIFLSDKDVQPFLNGDINYYQTIKKSNQILMFDYFGDDNNINFKSMDINQYLNEYGPQPDSDLKDELIDFLPKLNNFLQQQ